MFFGGVPGQRRVASYNLAVLSLDNGDSMADIVTFFMEIEDGEGMFAGSVEQLHLFDGRFGEQRADVLVVAAHFALETRDIVAGA